MRAWNLKNWMTSLMAVAACLALSVRTAEAGEPYDAAGIVYFDNLQASLGGLFAGEAVPIPYIGIGESELLGTIVQSGTILPDPSTLDLSEIGSGKITFDGVQGQHSIPGQGNVHIFNLNGGKIFCTWEATFTIQFVNADGDAILSGDGDFTVIGGTGQYRNATGTFNTLFVTDVVPDGADSAFADWTQLGEICK